MKKMLALALTLGITLSMSTTAFAAGTVGNNGGTQNIDVNAKYADKVETATVYHVDVEWGSMDFTYAVSGKKTWNSKIHEYTDNTSGSWSANGNGITVTNHSNTGIRTDFSYTQGNSYKTVTGNFSKASFTLPTAEGKATDHAQLTGTTVLTLDGTLEQNVINSTKVGTVTISISKE